MKNILKKTAFHFGDGWIKGENILRTRKSKWHFDRMREIIDFPVNQKGIGLEAGCGGGRDTVRLALANPESDIYAVDISEGINVTNRLLEKLKINNVQTLKEDLSNMSLERNSIDWCYSFGVIHHIESPLDGMREINRVMKPGSMIVTYLYSDLKEVPLLRIIMLTVNLLRSITTRLPLPILDKFCWILAIPIYFLITLPSKFLKINFLPYTKEKNLRQVWGGLHDRFGAQIEKRYNPTSLKKLYLDSGFLMKGYDQIDGWRGWVSWAIKIN